MEKFKVGQRYGYGPGSRDLSDAIHEGLSDDRPDSIDELRSEVRNLKETLSNLITVLYANGNSKIGFKIGLSEAQVKELCPRAYIDSITPA